MTRHELTLIAFGDDLALIAVAAWPLVAELRWRRRIRRARTRAAQPALGPHNLTDRTPAKGTP